MVPRAKLEREASLAFDDVTAAFETSLGHRYGHCPRTRAYLPPPHKASPIPDLRFGNFVVTTPLGRTKLAFSRRDTKAAVALREQVSRRLHD